jgi:hypothetical protein
MKKIFNSITNWFNKSKIIVGNTKIITKNIKNSNIKISIDGKVIMNKKYE